jgi:hypothetical protein
MDSLLNGMKYDFKKGQRIKYFDHIGKIQFGKFLMAGSIKDTVILDSGKGLPIVVPVDKLWSVQI